MKKKKYRSLNDIYGITSPMEALMVEFDEDIMHFQNYEARTLSTSTHWSKDDYKAPKSLNGKQPCM